jgi:hypothetical protein
MLVHVPVSVDGTLPSIIGLEKACRAFAGGATCVMVGDPFFFFFFFVSFSSHFLYSLIGIDADMIKKKLCPIILFLFQSWLSLF